MNKEELRFDNDKLFVYTPVPQYGNGIYKIQLVMTKEIFQECYKKWVESYESKEQKNCDTCIYSDEVDGSNCYECVKGMRNNYKAKSEENKE